MISPLPLPKAIATSAPFASPIAFTAQPITDILSGAFMCFVRSSIVLIASTKSYSIRPQVGQDIIFSPSLLRPLALKILFATLISFSNSPVIDTLIVSPMPLYSKYPSPNELFTALFNNVPASVTPM